MTKYFVMIAALGGYFLNPAAFSADAHTNGNNRVKQEGSVARENITDDQRARLRETNEKFRSEQNALYEKLRTARRDLEQTAQADSSDEKGIRAKAATLGQIEGDLAIVRSKHYKELRAILPHDQAARQSGLSTGTNQFSTRLNEVVRATPRTNAASSSAQLRPIPPAK